MPVWVRTVAVAGALATVGFLVAEPATASLPKHATQVTVRAGHTHANVDARLSVGSSITGQVTDLDGNPLSGAVVEVLTGAGQELAYTSTDGSGDFHAVSLPPTSKGYAVCVGAAGASSTARPVPYGYVSQCNGSNRTWELGTKPPSDARLVPTAVGQSSVANFPVTDAGALTGEVTSRATGVETDASVTVYAANGHQAAAAYTSSGSYTASGLAPGSYTVCFDSSASPSPSHPGYESQCYHDTSRPPYSSPPASATKVTVTSDSATEVDQSLPTAAAVMGTVRNARTHSPTPAAAVVVFAHGRTIAFRGVDRHGKYDIGNLPAETVDVCAVPLMRVEVLDAVRAGRRTALSAEAMWHRASALEAPTVTDTGQCWKHTPWNGSGSVPHAADEVRLHRGVTTSGISLAVSPPTFRSHISGRVRDAAGGVRNADVSVLGPNGSYIASTTTGKGGAYRVGVPASPKKGYVVCAGPPSQVATRVHARAASAQPVLGAQCWRKAAWNGAGRPPTDAPKVTVASGHTATGIDITLPRAGAIAGTVTYRGQPVPNLTVVAFDPQGDYLGFDRTDAAGRYRMAGLSPAKHYVVCFNTGGADLSSLAPDYGLRAQCYSGQAWDGLDS